MSSLAQFTIIRKTGHLKLVNQEQKYTLFFLISYLISLYTQSYAHISFVWLIYLHNFKYPCMCTDPIHILYAYNIRLYNIACINAGHDENK